MVARMKFSTYCKMITKVTEQQNKPFIEVIDYLIKISDQINKLEDKIVKFEQKDNKKDNKQEMHFSLNQSGDAGDINLFIANKDGGDSVLIAWICRHSGKLSLRLEAHASLVAYNYDIENLKFDRRGCLEIEQ